MKAIQVLKRARKLFDERDRWMKGDYEKKCNRHFCYCAVGAIRKVTKGGDNYNNVNRDAYVEALTALAAVIPKKFQDNGAAEDSVINWNDDAFTIWSEVKRRFDRAIKRLEAA